MLEATLSERAKSVLTAASGRSDVPAFMVMDVMAAAARIEAAGGHVIHMEVGQPAASAPKTAIQAAQEHVYTRYGLAVAQYLKGTCTLQLCLGAPIPGNLSVHTAFR